MAGSIEEIERRTGLNFGDTVEQADTIKEEEQPQVGEARTMIRSFADLLPGAR